MKLRIQSTISLQGKYSYIFCSTFQKLILISNIQFLQDNPRYLASEIVKNSSICHVYKYFRDQRCPTMSSEFIYDGLNIIPPIPEGGGGYTVLPLSVLPSVQDIFRRIFLSNCWWQKSDIWSQASYFVLYYWLLFIDVFLWCYKILYMPLYYFS